MATHCWALVPGPSLPISLLGSVIRAAKSLPFAIPSFYANLIRDLVDELFDDGPRNQGNFDDGAWVQEVINAVETAHHAERWVHLPLDPADS